MNASENVIVMVDAVVDAIVNAVGAGGMPLLVAEDVNAGPVPKLFVAVNDKLYKVFATNPVSVAVVPETVTVAGLPLVGVPTNVYVVTGCEGAV